MKSDKVHYYDGYIYRKLVDSANKELRSIIAGEIKPLSRVIDIGCGTGALVSELAKYCSVVVGIDASSKMIAFAEEGKQKKEIKNMYFFHGGIDYLARQSNKQFDYAVFSMSLHEMNHKERISMLLEAKRISKKIIIADFLVPQSSRISGLRVFLIEFIAGINHFKGYMDFRRSNGIDDLVYESNLKILSDKINSSKTVRIVVLE